MFGALFDAGVAGIGADDVLVTVQQFFDLADIRHVGCRADHAVYPMSSTLEIIHKYHIISAQISAWEKPF